MTVTAVWLGSLWTNVMLSCNIFSGMYTGSRIQRAILGGTRYNQTF